MSTSEHEKQHKYLEPLPTSDNQHSQQQNNPEHDVQRSAIHHVASDYVVLQQACDSFSKDSDAAEVLELVEDGNVLVRETKAVRSSCKRRRRSSHNVSTA